MPETAAPGNPGIIETVQNILQLENDASNSLINFSQQLFSDNQTDTQRLDARDLARLANSAFQFIQDKPKAQHKIRIYEPGPLKHSGRLHGDVTIVEILNDDMPFIVDSVLGELQERGFELHYVLHPILETDRDETGNLIRVKNAGKIESGKAARESFLQICLKRFDDEDLKKDLLASICEILDAVRIVVGDWKAMLVRVTEAVTAYSEKPPKVALEDLAESIQFLKWLTDNNFTFLGLREYKLERQGDDVDLKHVKSSGLGILRDPNVHVLRRGKELVHFTPEIQSFFFARAALIVTKANVRSIVHRRVHMDYIGAKIYDDSGDISGELRIVGLFTSSAYTHSTKNIPFLRHKVSSVLNRSGYKPESHSYKALVNVLEQYPRDELFQVDIDLLYQVATGILNLELRPRPQVFARKDKFDRFVSVLVFVPRNSFSTEVRIQIGDLLAKTFGGVVSAYYLFFPEGQLVRVHFIIGQREGKTPETDIEFLENEINKIITTWRDNFSEEINQQFTGQIASDLIAKYSSAFSVGYEEDVTAHQAVRNIRHFERLTEESPLAIVFRKDPRRGPSSVRVEIYHLGGPIPLSQRVPILENMGFSVIEERSYRISPVEKEQKFSVSQHNMLIETCDGSPVDLDNQASRLQECFLAVWRNDASDDRYNQLVLSADLNWREVAVFRSYGSYMRQIRAPFGQNYIAQTLIKHRNVTTKLATLFVTRFDPSPNWEEAERREKQRSLVAEIEDALAKIPSLDEDRILRSYANLINATCRTNFFAADPDDQPLQAISFKFKSRRIDELPEPKPFMEIFVYSPRLEGIHLRGGRVARGGIRWSDRPQDFRTEILSLAKAQQVKNTVIVPTGAKGGFVPKLIPLGASREEMMNEGIACYRIFISSLLSLTDNLKGGTIIPSAGVVRHDEDDPYLVVAADKGTAAFSDFANEISTGHGFWLGDAFASGGSVGYDHKKMGITARGAWEAVKRHFREIDIDIQNEPVDVIGIGDMSGDVFGNGMLLSKCLRLRAAFDHRDILIDPDPDPARSWEERKRLFDMGRSSWQDYDTSLISKGGGVFSRQLKSIDVTPEISKFTGLKKASVTPNELIRSILTSEADLLWFGGIGTYVRSSQESNDNAGDRSNDALRVQAKDLKVKVIGEGANLGMTHRARIEFSRMGGHVNTDAIDNSAGVNSSDLEVNIKITLGAAVEDGQLTYEARNSLLAEMTDAVAEACLENNYRQSLSISLDERRGHNELAFQQRLLRDLESSGLLDRELENLPDDAEITERINQKLPLTRPELAVLMGYSKIDLFNAIIKTSVPDDPYLEAELFAYFPETLRDYHAKEICNHRLRRDIIATALTNKMINNGDIAMVVRLKEETGLSAAEIAYAFIMAKEVFGIEELSRKVDLLDNQISGGLQLDLYSEIQDFLIRETAWFLKNADWQDGLSDVVGLHKSGIESLSSFYNDISSKSQQDQTAERLNGYLARSIPYELAANFAELHLLADAPDIVLIANKSGKGVKDVAKIYRSVGDHFQLDELKSLAHEVEVLDLFDRLALNSAVDAVSTVQQSLAIKIISQTQGEKQGFEEWLNNNRVLAERTKRAINEILASGQLTLSKLTVAVGQLRNL